LKDSGTDEFDAEALKNEQVSELDLKKIIEEWKHGVEKLLFGWKGDVRGSWLWLLRNQ